MKLLNCPFCGGKAKVRSQGFNTNSIVCGSCHARTASYAGMGAAAKWNARVENGKYPMQPISNHRFEQNPIVDWLATDVSNMNDIAIFCHENDIDQKYQEQLAQLVGYSVSGYGSLSYVSDESYNRADKEANK